MLLHGAHLSLSLVAVSEGLDRMQPDFWWARNHDPNFSSPLLHTFGMDTKQLVARRVLKPDLSCRCDQALCWQEMASSSWSRSRSLLFIEVSGNGQCQASLGPEQL